MELKGKNCIYIGGFGGLGKASAEELLKKHVKNLIIFDLLENNEYLKYLQTTYKQSNVYFIAMDITKTECIQNAYKKAVEKIQYFDVVVNGSGICNDKLVDATIAINLTGLIHSTLIAIDYMSKAKGGRGGVIVNIASVAGLAPFPMQAIYVGTKFGVQGFTRALANPVLLESTGVKFVIICPGITNTPIMDDMGVKATFPQIAEPILKVFEQIADQTPETYGKLFVEVLEKSDENGITWIVDNGKYRKLEFPTLWEPIMKN